MLREALTLPRLSAMTPDEASAYFLAHGVDGLTPVEQSLLTEWLAADRGHALAFDRAQRAWNSLDDADGHEILDAMRAHALQSRTSKWQHWPRILAVAAMLVLVATTSLYFLSPYRSAPTAPAANEAPWTQYAAADTAVRTVALSDGSVMTLDAGSLAQVSDLPGERSIKLARGRALFEVAKDAARPFAVAAAGRRVVALGTRFEVDTHDAALRVSLFRGKVSIDPLAGKGQTVFLVPGQQFLEKDGQIAVTQTASGDEGNPNWQRGMIDLDTTPLSEAIRQVNRYSRAQIRISDPSVAAIHVTGQFRAGDAERFAQTIAEVYPVQVVRRNDGIDLVPRK